MVLNEGQKYCRMLQVEHSAILLTFIKPPFVNKIFVSSIFQWLFYIGFTVILKTKSFTMFGNMESSDILPKCPGRMSQFSPWTTTFARCPALGCIKIQES